MTDPTLEAVKMTDPAPKTEILAKVITEEIPHLPTNLPAIAHKADAAGQNNGDNKQPRRVSFSANQSSGKQSKNVRGRGNGVVK